MSGKDPFDKGFDFLKKGLKIAKNVGKEVIKEGKKVSFPLVSSVVLDLFHSFRV